MKTKLCCLVNVYAYCRDCGWKICARCRASGGELNEIHNNGNKCVKLSWDRPRVGDPYRMRSIGWGWDKMRREYSLSDDSKK